jgi:polynucleotide kinase-phosphatase
VTETLKVPELSLVVLVGASGSGKSTFARKHFKATEILSSDTCRGIVSDDENSQAATGDAFELLHFIARKRLARGLLTVVDATNVQLEARKPLVALAREFHALPVAIVLDVPEKVCQGRNKDRPDRSFGPHVVRQQMQQLRSGVRRFDREGFRHVFVLESVGAIEAATIERQPLWNNRKNEHGPFDIVGDVHGCFDELEALLKELGYFIERTDAGEHAFRVTHPQGRKVVFVGDLVDRGPKVTDVLRLAMAMTAQGSGLSVPGNHDIKLMRKLRGKDVRITHGLAESLAQLEREPPEFAARVADFIDGLVSHYVFDDGKLVVAHAGLKEPLQGRGSGAVREFALYGETTGETDEYGLPVRYPWAQEYRGRAAVVYGHTPVPEAEWLNNTICIDTGCVFGGKLTGRPEVVECSRALDTRVFTGAEHPVPLGGPAKAASHRLADRQRARRRASGSFAAEHDVLERPRHKVGAGGALEAAGRHHKLSVRRRVAAHLRVVSRAAEALERQGGRAPEDDRRADAIAAGLAVAPEAALQRLKAGAYPERTSNAHPLPFEPLRRSHDLAPRAPRPSRPLRRRAGRRRSRRSRG